MPPSIRQAMLFVIVATSSVSADEPTSAFLRQHCIHCHGHKQQKADRRFDDLPATIQNLADLERYQEIIDQLNLASMPPEDEPQPTTNVRGDIITRLTRQVADAQARLRTTGGHSMLRRLNAWEYRQTIGDLLGLNVEVWNPAEDFPVEVEVDGFDNNGAGLVTSGMLLDHYLTAAEEAIQRATQFGPRPEQRTYAQRSPFYFQGKDSRDLPKLFQVDRFRFIPKTPYTDLYGRHYRGGHIGFLPLVRQGGVTERGTYTIRVRAAAVGREHDYGNALSDFRHGDPLVMEVAAVDRRGSVESTGNVSQMFSLAQVELTQEEPRWFEWQVYLDAGYEPEIRFRNGPLAAKRLVRVLTTRAADSPEFRPFIDMPAGLKKAHGVLQAYRGPRLRIWEVQLSGPHLDTWPTAGHRALYGELTPEQLNPQTIATRIRAFAELAFRRPPLPGELKPIQQLVASKLQNGIAPLPALQMGCQAILCSPGFLYLNLGEGKLDDLALASRLSYFLWSSPPDATLLRLAKDGQLQTRLPEQVTRMLADRKSARFVRHFVRKWLHLDQIGQMPPSEDFLTYYRDNLEHAMRAESEMFFRHILENNLPLSEFLTADYTFLNRELALHYDVQDVVGNQMRKVSLQNSPRGGLLGQGAFLTASANGVDTSPVVRGVYVLDKILGYIPPPPPADVPAIEPDIRNATTVREQLQKHRASATCAQCHRKIDPLGFALENFDAIGAWRDQYEGHSPIDPSGTLPNGKSFTNVVQFRERLLEQQDQFRRCLTEKLMTYALGRELEIVDRPEIDAMLAKLESEQGGLQDLIQSIVQSKLFLRNGHSANDGTQTLK